MLYGLSSVDGSFSKRIGELDEALNSGPFPLTPMEALKPGSLGPPPQATIYAQKDTVAPWYPVTSLDQTLKSLQEMTQACQHNFTYTKEAMKITTEAQDQPGRYENDGTDLAAFGAVTQKFEALQKQGSTLCEVWQAAEKDLRGLLNCFQAAKNLQQNFDKLSQEIRDESALSMKHVRFSSSKDIKTLPMTVIPTDDIIDLEPSFPHSWSFSSFAKLELKNGWYINQALVPSEGYEIMRVLKPVKWKDLVSEADPRYRTNEFVLARCRHLAAELWRRAASSFSRQEIIKTEEGLWKPKRINEIFKFTKYLSGTPMLPHVPGPWAPCQGQFEVSGEASFLTIYLFIHDMIPNSVLENPNSSAGTMFVLPHGTPIQFYGFPQGSRYVACTDIIFERFDPNGLHPYALPRVPPPVIQYGQVYQHVTRFNEPLYVDSVLTQQLEDFRRSGAPVASGLTRGTLAKDIWRLWFDQLFTLRETVGLQLVSKDFREMIISEEGYWKTQGTDVCSNFNELDFLGFPTPYSKFKAIYYAQMPQNIIGTVIDIGTSDLKYLFFSRTQKLQLKTIISKCKIYQQNPMYLTDTNRMILGEGNPIDRRDPKTLEFLCHYFAEENSEKFLPGNSPFGSKCCFLLDPAEPVPVFNSKKGYHVCEISVAAVAAYNRRSGVVVSFGHEKCWIEVVKYVKPVFTWLSPTFGEDSAREGFDCILDQLLMWFHTELPDLTLDFCLIGGRFTQDMVTIFESCLASRTDIPSYVPKSTIFSRPEERIYAPVVGAFLAPTRNRTGATTSPNIGHLFYEERFTPLPAAVVGRYMNFEGSSPVNQSSRGGKGGYKAKRLKESPLPGTKQPNLVMPTPALVPAAEGPKKDPGGFATFSFGRDPPKSPISPDAFSFASKSPLNMTAFSFPDDPPPTTPTPAPKPAPTLKFGTAPPAFTMEKQKADKELRFATPGAGSGSFNFEIPSSPLVFGAGSTPSVPPQERCFSFDAVHSTGVGTVHSATTSFISSFSLETSGKDEKKPAGDRKAPEDEEPKERNEKEANTKRPDVPVPAFVFGDIAEANPTPTPEEAPFSFF